MIKKIIFIVIALGLLFGLYKFLSIPPKSINQNTDNKTFYDNPDLVFYFGDTCPHCKNVEEWIKSNNVDQKIKINQKEVYKNINNQKELIDTVSQYCPELNKEGIGVPFGFDPVNKKCIQGDVPIIDFLSQKVK